MTDSTTSTLGTLAAYVARWAALTFDLRPAPPPRPVQHRHGCRCARRHRSWQAVARCVWPRAHWVVGEGSYALVARCGTAETVTLHPTREEAAQAARALDATGCGHSCTRAPYWHPVVELHSDHFRSDPGIDPMGVAHPMDVTDGARRASEEVGGHGTPTPETGRESPSEPYVSPTLPDYGPDTPGGRTSHRRRSDATRGSRSK